MEDRHESLSIRLLPRPGLPNPTNPALEAGHAGVGRLASHRIFPPDQNQLSYAPTN